MATPSQLAANRANARQSTGPRTAEGKSASSGNGFKSGIYATSLIVRGEDPAELDALRDGFYDIYAPEAADERGLVDTLIASEWTLRRLRKCTAQIWENAFGASEELRDLREPTLLADAFADNQQNFLNVQCLINSANRAFHRTLLDLQRLQKSRQPAQPPEPKPTSTKLASFLQNPPPSPAPAFPGPWEPDPSRAQARPCLGALMPPARIANRAPEQLSEAAPSAG
jgi:hypothetical protein